MPRAKKNPEWYTKADHNGSQPYTKQQRLKRRKPILRPNRGTKKMHGDQRELLEFMRKSATRLACMIDEVRDVRDTKIAELQEQAAKDVQAVHEQAAKRCMHKHPRR